MEISTFRSDYDAPFLYGVPHGSEGTYCEGREKCGKKEGGGRDEGAYPQGESLTCHYAARNNERL